VFRTLVSQALGQVAVPDVSELIGAAAEAEGWLSGPVLPKEKRLLLGLRLKKAVAPFPEVSK
jgi:hypothetical protein